jgi:hypothetical protein
MQEDAMPMPALPPRPAGPERPAAREARPQEPPLPLVPGGEAGPPLPAQGEAAPLPVQAAPLPLPLPPRPRASALLTAGAHAPGAGPLPEGAPEPPRGPLDIAGPARSFAARQARQSHAWWLWGLAALLAVARLSAPGGTYQYCARVPCRGLI